MAGYIVQFRDEVDKSELVESAQTAKEAVCDLWEKMAEHMPELHQVQERRNYYRNGGGSYREGYQMGNPYGYNGHLGYRNYGGQMGGYGMNAGGSFREGYPMGNPQMGGYGPQMGYGGHYRENPAYTGPGDARGI